MTTQTAPNSQLLSASLLTRVAIEQRRRPLTVVFGLSLTVVLFLTDSAWPARGIVREILFLIGLSLAAIGALGRTWSNLFISGYKTRELIQSGPYSICRNPLYFFSAIGMIGVGLSTGTLIVPIAMVAFFAAYYPTIIRCEEYRLSLSHQDEYEQYCRSTPGFWPRPSTYQEPETYTVYPAIMRKSIVDSFWFIALAALAHFVSALHDAGVLPAFVNLF